MCACVFATRTNSNPKAEAKADNDHATMSLGEFVAVTATSRVAASATARRAFFTSQVREKNDIQRYRRRELFCASSFSSHFSQAYAVANTMNLPFFLLESCPLGHQLAHR